MSDKVLDTPPLLVDISVIAFQMSIATGTAYNQLNKGCFPLPSYKVGGRRLFKYSDLIDWLANLKPELSSHKPKLTITSATNIAVQRGKGRPIGTTKLDLAAKRKREKSSSEIICKENN
ncbi:MAG: helix-turn-helix domain-containing protein [Betaproteobacteria bacterium]